MTSEKEYCGRRYYKRVDNGDPDPHYFRDDEIHEAIDNVDDCFFPLTVSIATKEEYFLDIYGEGNWTQEDWDSED